MTDGVEDFLDRFVAAQDDPERLAGCFAEAFLVGDRSGAKPVPRDRFLDALAGRRQMFADAAVGDARLDSWSARPLDDCYVLVRTEWTAPRLGGGDPVTLSSSFLLYGNPADAGTLTAVGYLNHHGL